MSDRLAKPERQQRLLGLIGDDPLLTDDVLAENLEVSVQTIRLDRLELGVPEMRERARELAQKAQGTVKALGPAEVTGDLVDVELGRKGISILEATQEMAFRKSGIVRGHYLFAQGNSLAVAVIDAPEALTGSARLRFHAPARVGDRIVAKAIVRQQKENRFLVGITSRVGSTTVFSAQIIIFAMRDDETQGAGEPF